MKKIIIALLSISILGLMGCSKTSKIQIGDTVTFSYTGFLENGDIFESGTKTVVIGNLETIKAIDEALVNKKVEQKATIKVKPENGYGNQYSLYNQQRISLFVFEKLGLPTKIGSIVTLDKTTGKIIKHEKDEQGNIFIVFDINPPQTRQPTTYDIHIQKVEKAGELYTL